ncbi:MAG: pyruvate:ferredoxin (flavodoxin) oxidoreductase [Polyangiaceae bacterium]|nr:pyruvate:ferredoxin (flavodoxin) oxidoreductase [Polyangiaceae bacterium]
MPERIIVDGNEAAARVAYQLSEVIAIYPITPASPMGEWADEWAARQRPNLWGTVPRVVEMQSEAGAIATVHGALQAGSLSTTFTASQGLLLMIPNLFKIAGELLPFVLHVAARTVATHALSIFGDHSDVMACRSTGVALLASGSVQEAQDMAAVAHLATLETRVPFLHFFDGFRTSHEVASIVPLANEDLAALVDFTTIEAARNRSLTPDRPTIRGTAQNPDVFFQAREAANPFYLTCPGVVADVMQRFGARTGRHYKLFDYVGHPEAERVVVMMGSGAEIAHEAVEWLAARGERVGLVKVRLFRPFDTEAFFATLPAAAKSIAVLDRTKEPGALGDPLYQEIVTALFHDAQSAKPRYLRMPRVVAGRYGLSSKEFTPAMVAAVYAELAKDEPRRQFTVGIMDDVTHSSLSYDAELDIEPDEVVRAVFYGLGSDGTVSANKNSLKIIGDETGDNVQGYFVYDSKKAGAVTVSHLRTSKKPLRSSYLIGRASFVACHQFPLLERYDMLASAAPGATFLLNAPFGADKVWDELPLEVQQAILDKKLRFFVIDAYEIARQAGLRARINTIMQTCFFALGGSMPREEAITRIKAAITKTYKAKGEAMVKKNHEAVDHTLAHLHEVKVPERATAKRRMPPAVPDAAPDFVKKVTGLMLAGKGDLLPVSAFPVDGTWPTATARWEKRNIATEIPVWDEKICIQCNKCAMVCPHAAVRAKVYPKEALAGAPATFKSMAFKSGEGLGDRYTIQIAPEDCTGCTLCVAVCPAKDKANPRHKSLDMAPQLPLREPERGNYAFFLELPEVDRTKVKLDVKSVQLLQPLFEYSGACTGCGETPYVKLLTQLFGDRALVANATGCSSIYGGNLPTTPYTVDRDGRGPAWCNSLFENNAEFGLGFRLAVERHEALAQARLRSLASVVGDSLVEGLLGADQSDEAGIAAQRARVVLLRQKLADVGRPEAKELVLLADQLVKKSVWIVGGDGWAYDIGYGGLDHVLASGENVNILVLDTEVYSNTGGQQSKATPMGAAAKFAAAGKGTAKKDLGLIAMMYGTAYVASVAFGAKDLQTIRAFAEADAYPGPSIIIAYSPCIAHGYDLALGLDQQKLAVDTGYWPLYRFDPRRVAEDGTALRLDSQKPKGDLGAYMRNEMRFRMVEQQDPERFKNLLGQSVKNARERFALLERLAEPSVAHAAAAAAAKAAPGNPPTKGGEG